MKALLTTFGLAATAVALTFTGSQTPAEAQGAGSAMNIYSVTITNLTQAQIFSPAVVATHNRKTAMFQAGSAAGSSLQALAEDGDNSMVISDLAVNPNVFAVSPGMGAIMPGQSETIMISADTMHSSISLATMLVSTNDTFAGADSIKLPQRHSSQLIHAYDAGTEFNSEDCAFIPGPPCGSGGVHDPRPGEGFIHISNGIHGIGGVAQETYDWRGPVAQVEITRL